MYLVQWWCKSEMFMNVKLYHDLALALAHVRNVPLPPWAAFYWIQAFDSEGNLIWMQGYDDGKPRERTAPGTGYR